MFSTARSASSVCPSRTTTGTSVSPSARGSDAVKAGNQLERAVGVVADDERDEDAMQLDRAGERLHVRLVELADVLRHADRIERNVARAVLGGRGHVVLLWTWWPAPLAGRSPATRTPARPCHPWVAGRPVSGRRRLGLMPVAVPAELQGPQLLARLAEQIAFADQDLVGVPRPRLALGAALHRATARRVPRDPSGRSSNRRISVTIGVGSDALIGSRPTPSSGCRTGLASEPPVVHGHIGVGGAGQLTALSLARIAS
jgi:hypothetical protein